LQTENKAYSWGENNFNFYDSFRESERKRETGRRKKRERDCTPPPHDIDM